MVHHAHLAHGGQLRAAVPYTAAVLLLSSGDGVHGHDLTSGLRTLAREVKTILVTDIVGSPQVATSLGRPPVAVALDRHDETARRLISERTRCWTCEAALIDQ
jgi:hypothetical protein